MLIKETLPAQSFAEHNEEVRRVWEAYRAGKPIRVPMTLSLHSRILVLNPELNREGITWEQFSTDPEVMFQTTLRTKHYVAHNLPHDIEMGIPEKEWVIAPEFMNVHEAAWLGCEIYYPEGQVTASRSRYEGAQRNEVFERGIPDPFSGFYADVKEFYEYYVNKAKDYEFCGRPIKILYPCSIGTDGPLTVACDLHGGEIFGDMFIDPDYFHKLLGFITDATILRIKAWRRYLGMEERPQCGYMADDSIQCISTEAYKEHVLPYHKRYFEELFGTGPHLLHICGNVQRHMPTLVKELNIGTFDTGFPVDFETLRDEVGEGIEILGGVKIQDLLQDGPEQIFEKSRQILSSPIKRGGKFILKEANNLPPRVPVENIRAMYDAVRQFGGHA